MFLFGRDWVRLFHNISFKKLKENRKQRPRKWEGGGLHGTDVWMSSYSRQGPCQALLERRPHEEYSLCPQMAYFREQWE